MKTSIDLHKLHNKNNYVPSLGWINNPEVERNNQGYYSSYRQTYAFDETVQLGESEVHYRQRTNPHVNHLGDFFNCDVGTYKVILKHLNKITGTNVESVAVENEMQLAKAMIKFCRLGKPMTIKALKKIKANVDENDVHN